MKNEVQYLMSQRQLNRYVAISKLIDEQITVKEASKCLGLCERQIYRLKRGVKEQGVSFLIHKNKGKKPVHAIPDQISQIIIDLKRTDAYEEANFLHFKEMLAEYEGINISYSALYDLLMGANFESPKKRGRFKSHRRRKRRPQEGLLIQMDASPHQWSDTDEVFNLNGNGFIFGVPGSGKSMTAKHEAVSIFLSNPNADVILIDPEREYTPLVNAFGDEVIRISATFKNHINATDINEEYGDRANPVILKSGFIMSLCEQLIGGAYLGTKQKSPINRCTANVYEDYIQRGYTGNAPTLQDFRGGGELLHQNEPEAKEIALAIELFTDGSLNTFAKPTNVDVDSRLICYDILNLGKQLQSIGMLVVLDNILNRIAADRAKGRQIFIFIDEIYLLFQHEYSANFLFVLWKRVREYNAFCTGITQNVDDMLQSHTARTMLANSEFIAMLNQASTDRLELSKLLNISDLQMSYITNVDASCGLIKVGSALVSFTDKFPRNRLYKLISTRPEEE